MAADPGAHRPHPVGSGSDLLLYDHFNTGRNRNYQGWDPDDIASVRAGCSVRSKESEIFMEFLRWLVYNKT